MGHQAPGTDQPAIKPSSPPRPPGSPLALRNWRVTWRLIALIAIPTMLGLVFGGLRLAAANSSANEFSQVKHLAVVGQQVTGLVQALEDERDITTGYVAAGRPATRFAQLKKQYAVTDAWAARVGNLAGGIGSAYPAQTQAKAGVVLARLSDLPGLRATAQGSEPEASPLITEYTTTIDQLLAFNNEIAQDSANSVLADTVRTLDSLSQMKDDASQQRALVYAALLERRFELGMPQAITAAQGQDDSDQSAFEASATLAQQRLYDSTVSGPPMDLAEVLEQLMIDSGTPDVASITPSRWYTSMTGTIGRMRVVEQELAASVVAQSQSLEQGAERSALLTGLLSLVLLLMVLAATFVVARSMVRPLRALRSDALDIAAVRLPEKVRELGDAEDMWAGLEVLPVSVNSADEIGEVARAFDQVHMEALRLAGNETMLRNSMNSMFVSLSRRSQSLLERLARLIDSLEQKEDDPGRLSNLFTMDHLVTRMRRHSENLLVLAGHEPTRRRAEPVALTDVVRASVSEIQQYNRVILAVGTNASLAGGAVSDVVHLLAEIIENATLFSAGDSEIRVTGQHLSSGGILIDVTDSGIGIPPERLAQLNDRLDNPPVADVSVSRHMGLFAVSHLAARHGVRVRLRAGTPRGLTALIWIPETLVTAPSRAIVAWPDPDDPEATLSLGGPATPGRHRSVRKAALSVDGDAPDGPAASGWANWDSPAGPGWRAAEAAATPVRGELSSAGLPQRIPRANLVPGSADDHPAPGAPRRSADALRTRLSGLQRGTRRAEQDAAANRARGPMIP